MERNRQDKKDNKTLPFLVAFLLCDMVIREEGTGKDTLVGIFDRVVSKQFPIDQNMTVYFRLANVIGHYEFRIDYVQVRTDKILFQARFERDFPEIFSEYSFRLRPPMVPIPEPGQYEFRLWANGHYVGRRTFIAEKIPKEEGLL